MPTVPALLIDIFLILLFAVQHSVMARPAFKRWWTKIIPEPIERSTYVLLASLVLMLLMWQWQPIGGVIWEISDTTATTIIFIVYFIGWTIFFLSTLGSHLDLFGLKQSWLYFRNKPYEGESFKIPFLYKLVRHPMYLGFLHSILGSPHNDGDAPVFTLSPRLYILTAIQMEERDLIIIYGESYVEYRNRVPMILPFIREEEKKKRSNLRNDPPHFLRSTVIINNCSPISSQSGRNPRWLAVNHLKSNH